MRTVKFRRSDLPTTDGLRPTAEGQSLTDSFGADNESSVFGTAITRVSLSPATDESGFGMPWGDDDA